MLDAGSRAILNTRSCSCSCLGLGLEVKSPESAPDDKQT